MKTRAYVETGFPGNAVADGLLLFEFCGLFQLRVWMSTSSNQWYVEMSAGITLGPMPFDAVVELVETSAIIRDDRVREGSSRDWKSVHQVPGLFADKLTSGSDSGAASLPSFEVAKPAGESTTGEQVKSEKTAPATAAAGGVVGLEGFELLLGELETASAFDVDDPASAGLPADASLEAAEPTAICPSKVKPQIRVEEGQGEASRPRSRLEVPDDVIPQLDITAPTPLKVPSAEPAASRTLCVPESSSIFTERETAEADARDARLQLNPAVLVSEGVKDEAAPAPQISVAALPQLKPTIQPWRPPTNRLKQLTVRGCLARRGGGGAGRGPKRDPPVNQTRSSTNRDPLSRAFETA